MKIKRPLFISAIAVLVVIYAINTLPESILYCSLALFVLFLIVHKLTADRYTHHLILFLLAAFIGAGWFGVFKNNLHNTIEYLSAFESVNVSGIVTESDNVGYTNCYRVKIKSANGNKVGNFKVYLYTDDPFDVGDSVDLTGKVKGFTPKSNYIYNYAQGIYGYFDRDEIFLRDEDSSLIGFFAHLRNNLIDISRKLFSYDAVSVAIAMGLGDKSLIDQSVVNAFNFTGISHTLVVSGLHVGFIAAVFNGMMFFIPVSKKLKNIVLSVLIFIFMGIIGFTPSIVRAGVLIIAMVIGRNIFAEIDNYTVLALIILITLFINPYSANNGSLLLSYTAYFGVIHAAELARSKNLNKTFTALLITSFAVLYTSPVLAMLGMGMTVLSPVFNLILSFVIMVICVLSFFLPVIGCIPVIGMKVALFFAPVNNVFIKLLLNFTGFIGDNFSYAMIDLTADYIKVIIFSVLIAIIIAFIQFTQNRHRAIFIFTVPICFVLCYNLLNKDVITVRVFDGSSEPSYVISYEDDNYLVATENINRNRLDKVKEQLSIDNFDEIIVCTTKETDVDFYFKHTDNLKVVIQPGVYRNDVYTLDVEIKNRQMCCILDISGVKIGFNHNKADMSGRNLDFYFFGSSRPKSVEAQNYYYFYPVIKKNADLVTEKHAAELYDILEIKIKKTNGDYSIVEDVKNFGNRI